MSACKECGLSVTWRKDGKTMQCFDPDGSVHWDLCSKTRFDKIRATGKFFETEPEAGYKTKLKKSGVQFTRLSATEVIGPKYKPFDHLAGCIPWDKCKCPK